MILFEAFISARCYDALIAKDPGLWLSTNKKIFSFYLKIIQCGNHFFTYDDQYVCTHAVVCLLSHHFFIDYFSSGGTRAGHRTGVINKLVFVKESEISQMISNAGGYTHGNKTANRSWGDRYGYIMKEGKGGGKMDFSLTAIPNMYSGASKNPLVTPSPMIFLVDGIAHNHMNFGNFLFGVTGEAMGFKLTELLAGAQYNSRFPTDGNGNRVESNDPNNTNGYEPQWDSPDDQFSIEKGFDHGAESNYKKKEWKVIVGASQP